MTSPHNAVGMAAAPPTNPGVTKPVEFASLGGPVSSESEGENRKLRPVIEPDAENARQTALEPTGPAAARPRPSGPQSADEPNQVIRQLKAMLGYLATYAGPALREIAARAAELAAKAAEAAGPAARKAAGVTDAVGGRLAAKGHEIASDLRGESGADEAGTAGESLSRAVGSSRS